MNDNFGDRLKKTAGEMAQRLGEAAHTAGERLGEMREQQRLQTEMRTLQRERDRCRQTIADLVIRMFDQQVFAEALLRPEYDRIKEVDCQLCALQEQINQIGQLPEETAAATPGAQDVEEPLEMTAEAAMTEDPSEAATPVDIPVVSGDELTPEE